MRVCECQCEKVSHLYWTGSNDHEASGIEEGVMSGLLISPLIRLGLYPQRSDRAGTQSGGKGSECDLSEEMILSVAHTER